MKISAIKQQVKRTDRYSVYIDGKFAFGLSEAALLEQGLASGQELTATQVKELKKIAGLDKAYGNALRYVALRPRSEWELSSYLKRKQIDDASAAHIIDRLRGLQLLDDLAFARAWVNNRHLLKQVSSRRLRLELQQKRVGPEIISQVLSEDETDERTTLRELIRKKQARYPDRQKLIQYLARQGFRYDDITSALHEIESEDESA